MEIIQRGYRKWKRRGENKKIQNDRAKPRSGQKMKGRGGKLEWESTVEKKEGWKDWNKVRQRETGGQERDGMVGGVFVSGRHFLSRGRTRRKGNNGGKDGGMAGQNTGSKKQKELNVRKRSCCVLGEDRRVRKQGWGCTTAAIKSMYALEPTSGSAALKTYSLLHKHNACIDACRKTTTYTRPPAIDKDDETENGTLQTPQSYSDTEGTKIY